MYISISIVLGWLTFPVDVERLIFRLDFVAADVAVLAAVVVLRLQLHHLRQPNLFLINCPKVLNFFNSAFYLRSDCLLLGHRGAHRVCREARGVLVDVRHVHSHRDPKWKPNWELGQIILVQYLFWHVFNSAHGFKLLQVCAGLQWIGFFCRILSTHAGF